MSSLPLSIGKAGARSISIFNGDTLELLQAAGPPCHAAAGDAGCTEPQALDRLARVIAAHAPELASIGRFARAGSNRVVLVPGDHDAALLFESVAARLVSAIGAPAGRVEIASKGFWSSPDGVIHAEHGHQLDPGAHALALWPAPFVAGPGGRRVTRSWGEQLVRDLGDRLEQRYPVVDNMSAAGAGLKYGLAADQFAGADSLAPLLLRYVLLIRPWQQFRMELDDGEVEPPVWDLAQARSRGAELLVSALPDDDPLRPLMVRVSGDGRLENLLAQMSDEELTGLCDYRAAVRRARRRFEPFVTQFAPRGPAVGECPRTPATGARCSITSGGRATAPSPGISSRLPRQRAEVPAASSCSSTGTRTCRIARRPTRT